MSEKNKLNLVYPEVLKIDGKNIILEKKIKVIEKILLDMVYRN